MAEIFTASNLIALLTLLALEIVLGIDNVIFIAILADKLPAEQRDKARQYGIGLAVITRILLLLSISWIIGLDENVLFTILGKGITGKDLVLLLGGAFLIGKSTFEIHEKLEAASDHSEHGAPAGGKAATIGGVIAQIVLIDIVFSLDSVITAVGIVDVLAIMIIAVVIASGIMLAFSGVVADFVKRHPTMKMLALSFLIMIGTLLVIEGWLGEAAHDLHLKNYAYFAMAFSFGVEVLNMRLRTPKDPVQLKRQMPTHQPATVAATAAKKPTPARKKANTPRKRK